MEVDIDGFVCLLLVCSLMEVDINGFVCFVVEFVASNLCVCV